MRVIIDRFEGEFAVVELNEKLFNVPRELFAHAKEGDAVEITVLGKPIHSKKTTHEIFERLRKNSAEATDKDDNAAADVGS